MMDAHAMVVAQRYANESEKWFKEYLRWCGWSESEVNETWEYAQIGEQKNE